MAQTRMDLEVAPPSGLSATVLLACGVDETPVLRSGDSAESGRSGKPLLATGTGIGGVPEIRASPQAKSGSVALRLETRPDGNGNRLGGRKSFSRLNQGIATTRLDMD